ncbi:spirocyclase AveC family protein [Mycobacterium sp. E2479]|uniref:spirocyclase AveC family protein n=1 Tax=Mycobacterium sp. E2479 TaxID=1834134 RepID=UPI000A8B1509
MATKEQFVGVDSPGRLVRGRRQVAWCALAVAVVALVAIHARTGAVSERIRNPDLKGAPRPVSYLFGLSGSMWLTILQIATVVAVVALLAVSIVVWRRQPGHPLLLIGIATTAIVWQDPILNWALYFGVQPAALALA